MNSLPAGRPVGKIFFKTLLTIRGCGVILTVTIIVIDYETPQRRSTPWKAPGGKAKSATRSARYCSRRTITRASRRSTGRLKPDIPDLSLGTVYRNLALFREEGKAMSVATVAGQERFDGRTHPHAHFICEKCGRVDDVDAVLPETLGHRRNARRGALLGADILRHLPLLRSGR